MQEFLLACICSWTNMGCCNSKHCHMSAGSLIPTYQLCLMTYSCSNLDASFIGLELAADSGRAGAANLGSMGKMGLPGVANGMGVTSLQYHHTSCPPCHSSACIGGRAQVDPPLGPESPVSLSVFLIKPPSEASPMYYLAGIRV